MKKVFIICLVFVLVIAFAISAIVISVNNLLTEKAIVILVNNLLTEEVKEEVENPYIVSAKKDLDQLRLGTADYEIYLNCLGYSMGDGSLSLADIGTDCKELEELCMKGYKLEAERSLEYLREGTSQYDFWLRHLQKELKKGDFSLADIGIDEKGLEELRIKGCKVSAEEYLSFLRNGTSSHEFFLKCMMEELRKSNLSLEDIDTNEDELRSLAPKPKLNHKKMAKTPWYFTTGSFLLY